MIRKFLLVSITALTLGVQSNAAVLTSWNFDGYAFTDPETDFPFSSTFDDGASGSLTLGGGINLVPDTDVLNTNNWLGASVTEAQDNGYYFQFTVTPTSGTLNLDSVTFSLTGDVPGLYSYSLFAGATQVGEGALTSGDTQVIFDLDNVGSTIFTLYIYANSSGDVNDIAEFGLGNGTSASLVVEGTVVPEPGTYALVLVGLAGMALIVRARRQRKLLAVQA